MKAFIPKSATEARRRLSELRQTIAECERARTGGGTFSGLPETESSARKVVAAIEAAYPQFSPPPATHPTPTAPTTEYHLDPVTRRIVDSPVG